MAATLINDLGGDSLFKTIFSGMVLREYETRRLLSPLVTTRQVQRGKAVDFSLMGSVSPAYHTPGDNLIESTGYLTEPAHAKVNVQLNNRLVATTLLDEFSALKNDFDARAHLSAEMGRAIADREDRLIAQALVMAALGRRNGAASDTDMYTGEPAKGGIITIDEDTSTSATRTNLLDALIEAASKLDEGNVPEDDRYFMIHSKYFKYLAGNTDAFNKDWGGAGALAEYKVPRVAGFQILKSTNFPNVAADTTPDAGENNELDFDPTDIVSSSGNSGQLWGVAFHKSAAACAKAMDIATTVDYKSEYLAHLITASNVMGTAALRRQSAVIIAADD